jgi:hypothetical protein
MLDSASEAKSGFQTGDLIMEGVASQADLVHEIRGRLVCRNPQDRLKCLVIPDCPGIEDLFFVLFHGLA